MLNDRKKNLILYHLIVFLYGFTSILGALISLEAIPIVIYRMLIGALGLAIFFLITNFGVWSMGSYGYTVEGFILCYTLALPFFAYSLISTFIFAGVIEGIIKLNFLKIET